jgi:hypothetical protein
MSNIYIKGLKAANVSITGDGGVPSINVSINETVSVPVGDVVGNDVFCDSCASFITGADISVRLGNATTGTLLTAAQMESIKSGTIFDLDDDAQLDYSEAGVIHGTTLKSTPVGADEIILEDSADTWAKKRATITSIAAAASSLDPSISRADGTINGLTNKATPIGADVMLVEDSAASFEQKNMTVTDLAAAIALINPAYDPHTARVSVASIALDTLNDEQSAGIGGVSTDEFCPTLAVVQLTNAGSGTPNGDAQITIGITTGGTEILAATALTGLVALNDKFLIDLTGAVQNSIPADSDIYVKVTTADTVGVTGITGTAYIEGQTFVAAT